MAQIAGAAAALPLPVFAQSAGAQSAGAQSSDMAPEATPNEIVGPYYPLAKPADTDFDMTTIPGRTGRPAGQIIEVTGRIMDLGGRAVPGARLEIWQANAAGRYRHPSDTYAAPLDPNFDGYALLSSDADGAYRFITVKPGPYPGGRRGMRTPHIHFDMSGRFDRLVAQMFFPNEPLNATDALLQANIRSEMVVAQALGPDAVGVERYRWDIVLRTG
jgi:protocatechuate 3,4-dioxygenase beta subunit